MNTFDILKTRYEKQAQVVIEALKKRGFDALYCEDKQSAKKAVLSMIEKGSSVSWGGSMSVAESGIFEELKAGDYVLYDRDSAKDAAERTEITKQAFFADYYLSSVNAISEDGVMINIDGMCNRIAAIAFGPKKVILLVSMEKVCRDAATARIRARTVAAPENAIRLNTDTPCTKDGVCHDCLSPACICSQIVEMRRSREKGRITVVLVGEKMGL